MSTLYNNKYDILASTIQPNPTSVKYWADLSSNANGGDLKYFNGTKWVLVNNKATEDISQIKQQVADLEQNKEDKGILCDKVTINGFDYYVSDEKATEGFYGYINFQGGDIKKIGKYIKVKTKDTKIPTLIISPRFITGSIFDKTKDEKPTTVVMIAKKDGISFDKTVFIVSLYWLAFLYLKYNSLYLSTK